MSDELEIPEISDTPETDSPEQEEILIEYIVEDGSCVPNANSYLTLEEANQYQANKNRSDWLALSDIEKQASLIKATQYVDELFTWKGRRKYESQNLAFPRVRIRDLDGFEVKGIPRRLKDAICEAAFYGFSSSSELFVTHDTNGAIKKQKVDVIEVEYFSDEDKTLDAISQYASLNSLLKGLYEPKESLSSVNTRVHWRG